MLHYKEKEIKLCLKQDFNFLFEKGNIKKKREEKEIH